MAVTFRAGTDDARGNATDATPAPPAGTVVGDLLICIQTSDLNGTLAAMTAPSDWALVGSGSRSDVGFMKVWRKQVTGFEPATYTFADSSSAHGSAIVLAITGHDPNTPIAVTPVFANAVASTGHVAPSVPGATNGLLITGHLAGTAGTTRDYTAPSGMSTGQKSTLTVAGNILTGAFYQALSSTASTGTKSATCTAATPYVAMSLVVGPGPQMVTPTGVATGETIGAATVTVAAAPAQTITPTGIATGQAFGTPVVQGVDSGFSGGLYPSESLFPSETLFPSDGGVPASQTVTANGVPTDSAIGVPAVSVPVSPDQFVTPNGIASSELFGSPVLAVANGPITVVATPIDAAEAFGVPVVTGVVPAQVIDLTGIITAEALGRPTVIREVPTPVVVGPTYLDTYFIDGVDLSTYALQIEVAEGLQDTPGTTGDNVIIPGLDGALSVWGALGQQRRPDGPGKITLSMWLVGVDPATGEVPGGSSTAQEWFARWDELVRLFHRRRLTIDHPRPDGTRRALAHFAPGESMAPSNRAASPWFGRFKATLAIPAAHWTDVLPVTTGQIALPTNGALSLSAFAAATAPCTELVITFGSGNNPRLSTAWGHLGWNGTIAPGQQLTINTATGELGYGPGAQWTPGYEGLTYSPGPRLFEVDPSESLQAILTHTGGGTMNVEIAGKRRYRTS